MYLRFPVSCRDLKLMLADRGIEVAYVILYRWVRHFAPELEKRLRRHLVWQATHGSKNGPFPSIRSSAMTATAVRPCGVWVLIACTIVPLPAALI